MKRFVIAALSCACAVGFALGLVACGNTDPTKLESGQTDETLYGSVLFVQSGIPEDRLGEDGDVCLCAESGDFYRKNEGAWHPAPLERYDIEEKILSVTYSDGTKKSYRLTTAEDDTSECDHSGLSEAEPYEIYKPYCVVPEIGVKYCQKCGESFPVILAADGVTHSIDARNFEKCRFCSKLEDGSSGFAVNSSNVENINEVVEQLQDGDTIRLEDPNAEGSPSTSPAAVNFTGEHPLAIGNDKEITVEVKNVDVSFTSGTASALSVGNGSTLKFTSENSEEDRPTINLDSATSKPAISVSGKGAVVNAEGVEINCHNTKKSNGDNGNPSISVLNGGELILGKGTVVNEKDDNSSIPYCDAYGIKATGNNSVVKIDGATINSEGRGAAVFANQGAEIDFVSGEINVSTTDSSVGLCVGEDGVLEMTGGVINVTGDLTGGKQPTVSRRNCAAAIGESRADYGTGYIHVTGGVINLTPTAGRAYAISTEERGWTRAILSGDLVIHVNAAEGAQAAAFAISQGGPCEIFDNVVINGYTAQLNKGAKPEDRNFFQWVDDQYTGQYGGVTDSRTKA